MKKIDGKKNPRKEVIKREQITCRVNLKARRLREEDGAMVSSPRNDKTAPTSTAFLKNWSTRMGTLAISKPSPDLTVISKSKNFSASSAAGAWETLTVNRSLTEELVVIACCLLFGWASRSIRFLWLSSETCAFNLVKYSLVVASTDALSFYVSTFIKQNLLIFFLSLSVCKT